MVNIHEYFQINWEATSDNIRGLMNGRISKDVLAKAMCVEKRTIYNWCNNKSHPAIDQLVLLAKFFNVDLLDILIINGQLGKQIDEDDYNQFQEFIENNEDYDDKYEVNNAEEFKLNVIYNEYVNHSLPIKSLEELLLVLPLFNPHNFSNVLLSFDGDVGWRNRNYILRRLKRLYDQIEDTKAKEYVKYYKEYFLTYPFVDDIDIDTRGAC